LSSIGDLFKQFKKDIKKSTGTDYTATVTRVENGVAYVQLTGAPISDTPATMSVFARPGDKVRVRVRNGKAWVTGNDTLPPSNEKKEVATKMSKDMSDRSKHIVIKDGIMKFIANTLCVDSKNFKLDEDGNAEFSGKIKGATYEDSTSNFFMDIGVHEDQTTGQDTPAFKIGGYINGDPNNDYLTIEMTLWQTSRNEIPQLYIAATVKDNPQASDEYAVSFGIGETGIDFYGSYLESGHLTRVHSSLPWGYNPH